MDTVPQLTEAVAGALRDRRPVVALESTIISHGFPRPRNLELAIQFERALTDRGVVPATVAVIDGVPRVGVSRDQLGRLAEDAAVAKASTRDLPVAVAQGLTAATTVAATSFLAARAGIRVFATGGLGGVHRDVAETMDESADIAALARSRITVVAAGVKSVLDIPRTLERLETWGVTVVGYRTDSFPAFWLTDSGHQVDWRVDGPEEVARLMQASDQLGRDSAILVANPVPADRQLDPELHQQALVEGLAALSDQGVQGKAVTPYLLEHMRQATQGASLEVNVHLVLNNIAVAADIATAWAR